MELYHLITPEKPTPDLVIQGPLANQVWPPSNIFNFDPRFYVLFQTRNYITCFGHICNHPHGQENHTQI